MLQEKRGREGWGAALWTGLKPELEEKAPSSRPQPPGAGRRPRRLRPERQGHLRDEGCGVPTFSVLSKAQGKITCTRALPLTCIFVVIQYLISFFLGEVFLSIQFRHIKYTHVLGQLPPLSTFPEISHHFKLKLYAH